MQLGAKLTRTNMMEGEVLVAPTFAMVPSYKEAWGSPKHGGATLNPAWLDYCTIVTKLFLFT